MGNCVFQIICYLAVSLLLLSLSVSGTKNGSEMNCHPVIRVSRNTVFLAPVMSVLKINCTVTLRGCQRKPRVSWCKLYGDECKPLNYSNYIRTEWKNITEQESMAFLVFLNISMEDAGFYRCKEGDMSIGHAINVTVTGHCIIFLIDNKVNKVSRNQSNTSNLGPTDDLEWLWSFVYICSGIAGLVVTVITVTLLIIRCQGRKSTRFKNEYMETHISDLPPLPNPNTRSPSDQLISASYRGCETPTIRGSSSTGRVSDGRHKTVGTERGEEENALVYASLNHQAASRGPRRTAQYEPEPSEYAAIRFQ
ncbi:B- and T-lymphocyte attenuator-like isoform X1 [Carassius gibelio]|uniref:B- and T-lymphocyte attenuator-like isoform X1 n=2 Tax=Carassius gibelio TaxID=101364 RepID=UPI002278C8D1|nr:B- and T-lymphocyte attenuator-like isoform X1 [Carassius gibelio]